jgi:serine palmitoyltransferase
MLIGSVTNRLNSSGGFCAGSHIVVDHQRINGGEPGASRGLRLGGHQHPPEHAAILNTLQENVRAIRAVLDRIDALTIPSHAASPIIHIHLRTATPSLSIAAPKAPNPATAASRDAPSFDIAGEERLSQDIVDEVLAQGVWITRARRLRGQELVESRPSIRLAVTAALSRKECERAAGVIKAAVTKVLTKRKCYSRAVIYSLYHIHSLVEYYDASISVMHTCS